MFLLISLNLLNEINYGDTLKSLRSIILFLFFSLLLHAQQKQFTMEDVALNSYHSLTPKKLNQLAWIPNTDMVCFAENNEFIQFNVRTSEKLKLISLEDLNWLLDGDLKLKSLPKIKWIDDKTISFWKDSCNVLVNIDENKIVNQILVPSESENRTISEQNNLAAYTIDNNLYVTNKEDKFIQITNETEPGIVSGKSVSRNEFGIDGGIFWSPKGNYLAFYQKDETEVADYPIVEMCFIPAKLNNIKYPMAGQKSEKVKVGVYNVNSGKSIWLNTDGKIDQYLTNITWDPSEKYIYAAHLNRDQNHMRLVKYDAATGEKVKLLFEEKDEQFVEPQNKLQFICANENEFIWFSERDGWQHLYLFNTEGELVKQITKGQWIVKNIIGSDKHANEIYFIGTKDSPIEDHLYKVKVKTGEITRITEPGANHKVVFNEFNGLFIDKYSSLEIPNVNQIINRSGKVISTLLKSLDPLADYKISKPKIFVLKGDNEIDLYSRIILPADFDSTKTYPVIVYVYGGPHDQLVTNEWYYGKYDFWFQYMAQRGFIIFTLDNRGSANRGLEFEQAVFGRLGTREIEDQLIGVKYLKSLSFVDSSRIGVYGWSYGGFMTTSLMLRTNNTFKVGVGGGSVIDWKLYEVMYGERYMDTPEKNPEGYAESNLLNYVENLNGKLLLVHGTSDPTVVLQHALEFAKKAAELNKPLDFFPYVGHVHGVKGYDTVHLYEKISKYFFDNL